MVAKIDSSHDKPLLVPERGNRDNNLVALLMLHT